VAIAGGLSVNIRGDGLRSWVVQRISAIYMSIFFIYLFLHIYFNSPHSYQEWRDWVSQVPVNSMLVLFVIALLLHVWVGMRDVVMDYIHHLGLRLLILTLLIGGLFVLGIWMFGILYSVVAL
jgi:succinate dehydrogenase / fumarate reductase membrane anchor subunit